jgi:hypothetical protein
MPFKPKGALMSEHVDDRWIGFSNDLAEIVAAKTSSRGKIGI